MKPSWFPCTVCALLLLCGRASDAALRADELVLIANANIPASVQSAEFYAKARLVPEGRILKLNLPASEEISFDKYEQEVVPAVRAFLREGGLDKQVRCAVTFFGIPIRIAGKQPTPEEQKEIAELKQQVDAVTVEVKPLVKWVEDLAKEQNREFTPRVGEDPADLLERANAALQDINRNLPPAGSARQQKILAALLNLAAKLGGEAEIAAKLSEADFRQFAGEEAAKGWPARRAAIEALGKEAAALKEKRYDAASRQRLRDVAKEAFGLFGQLAVLQSQVAYLENDGTAAAFDSELALLWWDFYGRSKWQPNPLHFRSRGTSPPVMMVCRLDGPQEGAAMQIVLGSLRAEKAGLQGRFVIDAMGGTSPGGAPDTGGGYRAFDAKLEALAQIIRTKTKIPLTFDRTPQLFPPNSVKDVALYVGWYSLRNYIPAFTFNVGAVGYHIASFEMVSLRTDNEKGWVAGLLGDGVVGTCGAVAEPYLEAMPAPEEFFPLLLTGKLTLAEVYWKTVPMTSWMMCFIGDPLYTPYKVNPQMNPQDLHPALRQALEDVPATKPAELSDAESHRR